MKNLLFLLCFWATSLLAQPTIQWQKALGGSYFDEATCIQQTSDGGYIVTGNTASANGDVIGNHGVNDYWVVKLSSMGLVQWKKALGGSGNDWPTAIRQTKDGGYIVVGLSDSDDGDVLLNHGNFDCWIVKLDHLGVIEWQKSLGGSDWDDALSVQQTFDDGYIIAGSSSSENGDVTENQGGQDFWIVKLSNIGLIEWQKSLGGSNDDIAQAVKQTADGGYIMVGEAFSNDGDVVGNNGNVDFWVVKLSSTGELEWQKPLGGTGLDVGEDILQTPDGGYIVAGLVSSHNTGDVSGHNALGGFDFWIAKLSSSGELQWQKALGGSGSDSGRSIAQTSDGNYVIAGTTTSSNGDVIGNDGGADYWIVKVNDLGEILWQKTFGGTQAELGFSMQQTSDDGYIMAGYAWSNNGDVSGVHGYNDFWIVKLSPETVPTTEAPNAQTAHLEIYPNPAQQSIILKTASEESSLGISIYDLLGRAVLQQNIPNGGRVDIASLVHGLYLVVATSPEGEVFTGKLRKQP